MKKKIIVLLALALSQALSFSQTNPQQQNPLQQQQQIQTQQIRPIFVVDDMVFVIQTFNSIEITGNEIDPFLNAKKTLQTALKKAQEDKKQLTDTMKTEMQVQTAQDILTFLQRGKFAGANAEKFKRFVEAIIESAKALNLQPHNKN